MPEVLAPRVVSEGPCFVAAYVTHYWELSRTVQIYHSVLSEEIVLIAGRTEYPHNIIITMISPLQCNVVI